MAVPKRYHCGTPPGGGAKGETGMQVVDPIPFFGDSGMRELRLAKAEAAVLLRAASIVEKAHGLVTDALGDGHYDLDINLCETPDALRQLAADGRSQSRLGW